MGEDWHCGKCRPISPEKDDVSDTFKCEKCGGVFDKGWTDEEAVHELHTTFGENEDVADCAVVCDDCYKNLARPHYLDPWAASGDK